jgi:hypothetical protein
MPIETTANRTPFSPGASHLVPLSLAILGMSQSGRLCDEQVVDGSWLTLCQAAQAAGRPGDHYNPDENSL